MNALLFLLTATGAVVWAVALCRLALYLWGQARPLRNRLRRTLPGQAWEYLSFVYYGRRSVRRDPPSVVQRWREGVEAIMDKETWRHPFFVARYRAFVASPPGS